MEGRYTGFLSSLLILSFILSGVTNLVSAQNIVSGINSNYVMDEYYGVLVSPESAIDGNLTETNNTRIITWCMYYVGSDICEQGESFIRVEYTIGFDTDVDFINLTTISKNGYLHFDDPWGLEMSISVIHGDGTDILWSDIETPGYINYSSWELNNTGPIPTRANNTVSVVFEIRTTPFYVAERDVVIELQGISATEVVWGCLDELANNYSPEVTDGDQSCDYDLDDDGVLDADEVLGCTDQTANNFDVNATDEDQSCDYDLDDDGVLDADEVVGCTDQTANNFDVNATDEDQSCDYDLDNDGVLDADEVLGCTNQTANNYDVNATDDDQSCDYDLDDDGVLDADEVVGCTNQTANNFDVNATDEDQSCDYDLDDDGVLDADEIVGCTNLVANNFNPNATDEDQSCDFDLDDDGILDAVDLCPEIHSNRDDFDSDGIPDACDGINGIWSDDFDNDGYNTDDEKKCNTDDADNSSVPTPWCGEESGVLNVYNSCIEKKDGDCTETLMALAWWNVVGLLTILAFAFTVVPNNFVKRRILSFLFNRKITARTSAHNGTRRYIEQEFGQMKEKILAEIVAVDDQQYDRFSKKIEADLAKLSLDLKQYIEEKHSSELFDESVISTISILRENVDENEDLLKKVVFSKLHEDYEEE